MKVVLMRHGAYGPDDRLSDTGKSQIIRKMPLLSEIISNRTEGVTLLTSSAPRATDSMEVIAEGLKLPYNVEEKLWSDYQHAHDFPWLIQTIEAEREKGTEVLLCVTHLEYVNYFPNRYAHHFEITPTGGECGYAEGVILNLEEKAMTSF